MARKSTAKAAAKKAPAPARATRSMRETDATRGAADAERARSYGGTETSADARQAAHDHTTAETAEFGTAPYTAGAPNIQTGAIDRAIAQGERARFRR